jgi:hypothetical protein
MDNVELLPIPETAGVRARIADRPLPVISYQLPVIGDQ